MKKAILLAFMLLPISNLHAQGEVMAQEMLAIAKYAGACGILKSMSAFQNATQMPAGDEFLNRYWSTESTRVGKTPTQYITDCNEYISLYETFVGVLESGDNLPKP